MKQKLFNLACAFVFMWTIGEVFQEPHAKNLINCICVTGAYAIWLGLHQSAWKQIRKLVHV